jgi:hypothetical protein
MDLLSILQWLEKDDRIKIVKTPVPFFSDYVIADVSFKTRGKQEDALFLKDPNLCKNLRRGTSFLLSSAEVF